ncbi:ANTAR domain-containing response regulator [Streptomyces albus]|uniref:ANTAR domain-containing response regulator n=1 Tax=Streptomyces albus TaxID=1888 RepID=UPI00068F14D8|nr:ANTAR domain-containing protein [Streptomyces albus]
MTGDGWQQEELRKLRTEVAQLRRAMETRPAIDQARGMLMATFRLTVQQSWDVLVATSQNTNIKLHRLADALVGTVHGTPLPKAVHKQLAAAVTKVKAASAPGGTRPASGPAHRTPERHRGAAPARKGDGPATRGHGTAERRRPQW